METKWYILRDADGFELGSYVDFQSACEGFYALSLREAKVTLPDGRTVPWVKIKNGTAIATIKPQGSRAMNEHFSVPCDR